jgi:hypothetical protein
MTIATVILAASPKAAMAEPHGLSGPLEQSD